MARTRKMKNEQPQTTAQTLGSLLKSARDIMRKDKGLNGDLDRLPMLTWSRGYAVRITASMRRA
jgi:type I restriction enzyme M protein